jgi:hypothetical protein
MKPDRSAYRLIEALAPSSLTETQNSTSCIGVSNGRKMWYLGLSFSGLGDRNGRRLEWGSEGRFAAFIEALGAVLGHADRQEPMRDYCLGLLMPIERKSVEPMAAVTAPAQVAAKHQSLLHFVGNAPWSDAAMLARVGQLMLPAIGRSGPIEAWIIDVDQRLDTKVRLIYLAVTARARRHRGHPAGQKGSRLAVALGIAGAQAKKARSSRAGQQNGPRHLGHDDQR